MEHENASWNDLCAQIIRKDVIILVSSEFLQDVEPTKSEPAALDQEVRNLRTDLKEHRITASEKNFQPVAPTQKEKQKNCPIL